MAGRVRLQNLATLAFDIDVFLREGPRATSSLELVAGKVKNRRELAFDIPPRGDQDADRVPKSHRAKSDRPSPRQILFVRADGGSEKPVGPSHG